MDRKSRQASHSGRQQWFSVRDMTEPSALQHAFDDFYFWESLRGIRQVLAFYADI